jgi:aquaporin Z
MVVTVLVYSFGYISGANLNPAVTVALFLAGELPRKYVIPYISVQVIGATLSSFTLLYLFGEVGNLGATQPSSGDGQSFLLEYILTFILQLVILLSAVHRGADKSFGGIAIGVTVGFEALFGGPISGASMNPARSIGPALASGDLHSLWIYIFAPVVGAITAVYIYKWLK